MWFQSSVGPLTSGLRRLGMIAAVSLRLVYLIFTQVLTRTVGRLLQVVA